MMTPPSVTQISERRKPVPKSQRRLSPLEQERLLIARLPRPGRPAAPAGGRGEHDRPYAVRAVAAWRVVARGGVSAAPAS
jgi:hypothetical protein